MSTATTNNTCERAARLFDPRTDPRPVAYSMPRAVSRAHDFAFRGGRTSNITAVLSADSAGDEIAEEYIRGVLTSAIFIGCVFIIWMIVLCVLKCPFWSRKVGVYSGHALPLPQGQDEKDDYNNNHTDDKDPHENQGQDKKQGGDANALADGPSPPPPPRSLYQANKQKTIRTMNILRYIAAVSGLGVFIACAIMLTKGIESLDGSLNEATDAFTEGSRLALQASNLIEAYAQAQAPLIEQVQNARSSFNGFCPAVREEICETDSDGVITNICNFTGIPLAEQLQNLDLPRLNTTVFFDALQDYVDDLREVSADLLGYEEDVENVEWPFKVAKAFTWLVICLNVFVMISLATAWNHDLASLQQTAAERAMPTKKRKIYLGWVKKWLLMPLFSTFVLLCSVFSTVFAIVSIMTADFCYGNPDDKVLVYVETHNNLKTIIHNFFVYYVARCPPDRVPLQFNEQIAKLQGVFDPLSEILEFIETSAGDFQDRCGSNVSIIKGVTQVLQAQVCIVRDLLINVGLFFSCANWHPLYATLTHDAVCKDGAHGFHWLAVSQFLIVLFSMILLTVRAGLYEMERPGDEVNSLWKFIKTNLLGYKTTTTTDNAARIDTNPTEDKEEKFRDESANSNQPPVQAVTYG